MLYPLSYGGVPTPKNSRYRRAEVRRYASTTGVARYDGSAIATMTLERDGAPEPQDS